MPVKKTSITSRKSTTSTTRSKTRDTRGTQKPRGTSLAVPMYSLEGKSAGELELPKEIFGAKVNKSLLNQAIRIYVNNQKSQSSHTKTRGEVSGSTRKIRVQKGTGGARHGSIKAPIFVGGGIALGPKYRKVTLDLPKKMKKAALISALSEKLANKEIIGVSGLDEATGKTSQMAAFFKEAVKGSAMLVLGEKQDNVVRAVRNLPKIAAVSVEQLNILPIIRYQTLIFTKEAIKSLESRVKSLDKRRDTSL